MGANKAIGDNFQKLKIIEATVPEVRLLLRVYESIASEFDKPFEIPII